jgi:PST family polysaccharide transporter
MAFVSMPLSVFLMICSNEVVLLLLGENWLRSVELFRVMSIVAFFQPTLSAAMALAVLPLGHSRKYFNLGLIRSVIVSVSICVGVCFGVNGVALAYAIATCISMTVLLPFYLDGSPVKPLFLLSSLWKPLFGSFFSGCLLYLIKMEFFSDMKITLRFGACLLSFAVLYLCLMFIFIKDKKKFASMLRR